MPRSGQKLPIGHSPHCALRTNTWYVPGKQSEKLWAVTEPSQAVPDGHGMATLSKQ